MYIKDPNSNRLYALDSVEGRVLSGKEPVVEQEVTPSLAETYNTNPYYLTKPELMELASGLDLKLTMRMREGTMVRKIGDHIENAGG